MPIHRFSSLRPLAPWAVVCALGMLSACSAPYEQVATDPQFGQSVRPALQAQQLPITRPSQPTGTPYSELEPALDRYQKAKPQEATQYRSTLGGSSLFGQ
jgi:hypothetical protein